MQRFHIGDDRSRACSVVMIFKTGNAFICLGCNCEPPISSAVPVGKFCHRRLSEQRYGRVEVWIQVGID